MTPHILAPLHEADRRAVLVATTRRRYRRRETLFHEGDAGDSVHFLVKGHVAIRASTPLGDVVTLTVMGPGASFGELALLRPGGQRTASAVAVDAVETLVLHHRDFEALCADQPGVRAVLVHLLAARVDDLSVKLVEALHLPADERVVRRLAELADVFGHGSAPVVIPVTQDDVASMAGTTRPTANRVLQTLSDRGLVELSRGRITVTDPAALRKRR